MSAFGLNNLDNIDSVSETMAHQKSVWRFVKHVKRGKDKKFCVFMHGKQFTKGFARARDAAEFAADQLQLPLAALRKNKARVVRKTSKYDKGVSWHCQKLGWAAQKDGKTLGIYIREEQAAKAVGAKLLQPQVKVKTGSNYRGVVYHKAKGKFTIQSEGVTWGGLHATDKAAAAILAEHEGIKPNALKLQKPTRAKANRV